MIFIYLFICLLTKRYIYFSDGLFYCQADHWYPLNFSKCLKVFKVHVRACMCVRLCFQANCGDRKRVSDPPGAVVTGGCKPPDVGARNKLQAFARAASTAGWLLSTLSNNTCSLSHPWSWLWKYMCKCVYLYVHVEAINLERHHE